MFLSLHLRIKKMQNQVLNKYVYLPYQIGMIIAISNT